MRLPNAPHARVEQIKVTNYQLSVTNSRGRSKANFFLRFGFSPSDWQVFGSGLVSHGASYEVAETVDAEYGSRYYVDGSIESPDGRNPWIKTVWQYDMGTEFPRLITARPLGRQNGASRT